MSETKRITDLEKGYVQNVLATGFSGSAGATYMLALEKSFARRYGVGFAISMVNGTATLHAALEAAGIGQGDEVVVPPLTMASTSLAVIHANATPVFADVDPQTFQIDPEDIAAKITPRTRAIIPVALYGGCPDLEAVMTLAKRHDLVVVEDNAQAFLTSFNGRLVGTFGHCASFSFQSSKHLASGEGGIIITDDPDYALRIRKFAGLGYSTLSPENARISKEDIQHPDFLRHDTFGWNYRMPELCCGVALAQTERMDQLVALRREAARHYLDLLSGSTLLRPQQLHPNTEHSYWCVACLLDTDRVDWETFRRTFLDHGGAPFYGAWQLTYREPIFQRHLFGKRAALLTRRYESVSCPVAESIQPALIQFKTNFWSRERLERQMVALEKTLEYLE